MKLGVIGDEVSQDLQQVVAMAAGHGFDGVEVRSVWGRAPAELTVDDCRRIRQVVADAGLAVAGFDSPVGKEPLPVTVLERRSVRDRFRRMAERAGWMGAPRMRVFSFLRDGAPRPDLGAEAIGTMIGDDDPGVELVVESGTLTNTVRSADLAFALAALDRPGVAALWDPANGVFCGMEPDPFPDGYEAVRPWVGHVHVKDPLVGAGYTELGRGSLPWPAILGALAADGFTGYVSLETHWRVGRVLIADERERPWGHGFSDGGGPASDRCMAALRAMAEEAHGGR